MSADDRNGNCFEVALKIVLDKRTSEALVEAARLFTKNDASAVTDFRIRLAHGIVSRPTDGLRHCHAWVELGMVFVADLANNRSLMIPRERYYMLGEIREEELVRYTPAEASEQARKHQHYGPWEERLLHADEGVSHG